MKMFRAALLAAGLMAAVAAAWWLQNRPASAADSAARAGPAAPISTSRSSASAAPAPVVVEVRRVQAQRLEDEAQAIGSLRALQGVMLRPEVSGRIQKLGFVDGQRVRKGQVLMQLEDSLQRAQLQQADAQAAIARTNLERNRELVAQNFVSQSGLDQVKAALEVAEAQVALARAQLERMKVLAPFDAVAGIRLVSVGDYVKDGADLVQLEDLSSMWLDFRLPERHLAQLRVGQPVALTLDSLPGKALTAAVAAVDSQLESNGRSVLVRARLANLAGQLRTGMFARVRIVFGVRESAITAPEEALVPQGDQQFVVKVIDGPNGAKLGQRMLARIGSRSAGRVEILEGLKPGDWVVVAGQARLMRGEPQVLRVVEVGAGTKTEADKAVGDKSALVKAAGG